MSNYPNYTKTRFPEIGYTKNGPHWRFVDTGTGATIGDHYPTKTELLCDLQRFWDVRFSEL
jgi:hypothetical protein